MGEGSSNAETAEWNTRCSTVNYVYDYHHYQWHHMQIEGSVHSERGKYRNRYGTKTQTSSNANISKTKTKNTNPNNNNKTNISSVP